jgi:hypothetical protein
MGLFERLSKKETKEKEEELLDIYEEILNIHNKLERFDNQLAQLREVDQQLQEAISIKKAAAMVAEKLEEAYRDVQLISKAIKKDDKEMRNFIVQQVAKIELIAKKFKEQVRMELSADYQKEVTTFKETYAQSLEQFQQEMKQQTENLLEETSKVMEKRHAKYQSAMQQLENELQILNEHVREEQKKHEQELSDLKKELLQKEKLWQRERKQRDIMIIAAILLLSSLSLWALWN